MNSDRIDAWQPDSSFDDPARLDRVLAGRLLPLVNRPARYIGGETGAAGPQHWRAGGCNVLLCFPDAYEVGMSHTGLRVLYTLVNGRADAYCDLAFAPWPDLEALMRRERLPLFGLQTRRPARQFDIIGFSLGYELTFTNMLTMLDLAGLAVRADQRREGDPLLVAGGSCAMNPTVVAPFCDLVLPGDGEEVLGEVVAAVAAGRQARLSRDQILARVRTLPGVWWPAAPAPVRARILADLNAVPPPRELIPVTEPVHDRLAIEVMRGCARGCRFCQAGMIQRPVRERDVASVVDHGREASRRTGYGEVGFLSLSTSDYSGLGPAVRSLQAEFADRHTNLVLPSLRMDGLDAEVQALVGRERPASATFAPEAGTQRLRDVINKQLTEPQILQAVAQAIAAGVARIKLYFMIGLPTETDADLDGIVALCRRVVALLPRGGGQVTISISPFAPKPHTPFQWAGQIPRAEIDRRNRYLADGLRPLKAKVSLRQPEVSFLEAVLGLGDASLAAVLEAAWRDGARFDGWEECFDWDRWVRAFKACGIDGEEVVAPRDPAAPLPWDVIQAPVSRSFLQAEWDRARAGVTTPDCKRERTCTVCAACGGSLGHVAADLAPPAASDRGPAAAAEPGAAAVEAPPAAPEHPRWRFWRERASAKIWCRLEFAKHGAAVFLGHLDFQRQLQLALRRSGLPIAYSKGYHPHPLAKYGPPLAVGVAGECEIMDLAFQWVQPDWFERLAAALPAGLTLGRGIVVGSTTPPSIDAEVERFDYRVVLAAAADGGPAPAAARAAVAEFLAAETWPYKRCRPDRPPVEVDVRRLVFDDDIAWLPNPDAGAPPALQMRLQRDTDGAGLPVHDVLAAIFGAALPEPRWCAVTRTGLYGRDTRGTWVSPFETIMIQRERIWLRAHLND